MYQEATSDEPLRRRRAHAAQSDTLSLPPTTWDSLAPPCAFIVRRICRASSLTRALVWYASTSAARLGASGRLATGAAAAGWSPGGRCGRNPAGARAGAVDMAMAETRCGSRTNPVRASGQKKEQQRKAGQLVFLGLIPICRYKLQGKWARGVPMDSFLFFVSPAG